MRALVVEPHDVNELIFASYLSHPFLENPAGLLGDCIGMDIDAPTSQACGKARILAIFTDCQR